jgi:hypothetical protein
MTGSLVERYYDRIAGVLSCYDRVVVTGTLPTVCYADIVSHQAAARKSSASGSHWTLRWREMDSNLRFRTISDGGPWSATRSLFKIVQDPALMPSR